MKTEDFNQQAVRVTPERVEEVIINEAYHVYPDTTLTICCLTLANGFIVVGESACVSMENFDAGLGRKLARDEAVHKIWMLEGYALRERIHTQEERKKDENTN